VTASRPATSLENLVKEAAALITRFEPAQALAASKTGALIIDIRSQDARELHGVVPGSIHIPRTVLEWRVAPGSDWRSPYVGGPDQQLILICDHGCSSVLAAGNLVALGFHRAGDVIGGFEAWERDGLPVAPWRHQPLAAGELPGMGPPD
jgi:rhodanese-related sulfurtransferase